MHISLFSSTYSYEGTFEGVGALLVILVLAAIALSLVGALLLPALIVAGLTRRQAEKMLNNRVSTVVTQYDPPHDFTPAEMGLLYDMHAGKNEYIATLFHLEQRHIISIKSEKLVEITNQEAYKKLPEYEKIAIRIANGETNGLDAPRFIPVTITIEETVQTINFPMPQSKSLSAFSNSVQASLKDKGIKMKNFKSEFALRVVIITFLVSLLPMLGAATPITYNGVEYGGWSLPAITASLSWVLFFDIILFPVYVGASILLVFIWTKIAGRYWLNSKQARAFWPEIEGYRLYLKQVDLDNIQFESTTAHINPVTNTLPYAMVFGFDTKWQTRLSTRISK